jgi:hypothetical protein
LGGIEGRRIWQVLWRGGFATLVMGAGLWAWISLSGDLAPWLVTLVGVALGGVIYGGLMLLLKVDEVGRVISLARARLHI